MQEIPTVKEALDSLDVVRRFLEGINRVFVPTQMAQGQMFKPTLVPPAFGGEIGPAPKTWKKRVIAIMQHLGRPVRPADITAEYRSRRWPDPKKTKLPNMIRSSLAYLKKSGIVEQDDSGNYTLNRGASL